MGAIHQALLAISGGGGGGGALASVVFITGAEHESVGNEKWKLGGTPTLASAIAGANGRYYDNASNNQTVQLPSTYAALTIRCRFQVRQSQSGTRNILKLQDSTGSQIGVHWSNPGNFAVVRGTSTHLDASSGSEISLNTWYWAEVATLINNATGSFEARLYDDSTGSTLVSLSGSGVDTQETVNAFADRLLGGETNIDTVIDNVSVSNAIELLGRCPAETLYPNGLGDITQLTRGGVDSGANWSQCDEATANGDTDTVFNAAGADLSDCYPFQDRSLSGTPLAVQIVATGRQFSGSCTIRVFCRISGVTYEGSITHTLTTTHKAYFECWSVNPATGNAWADAEINAAQFGVRCLTGNCIITQLVIEVLVQI